MVMMIKKIRRESGFGLIEVLIALAIMGVLVVVIMSAMTTSTQTIGNTADRETAKNLGQYQMEQIKNPMKQAYVRGATTYPPADVSAHSEFQGYSAVITVSPVANRDADIQLITITVTGQGETFVLQDYKINTLTIGH